MNPIAKNLNNIRHLLLIMYLATCGALCVIGSTLYLGAKPNFTVITVSMGIIFGVYMINRFTDAQEDFVNNIGKHLFFANKSTLYNITIGILVAVFAVLVAVEKLRLYHIILVSAGIFYSYRLVPWYKKDNGIVFYRLKDIPAIKNITVAVFWGISIFLVPYMFAEIKFTNKIIISILTMAITISTFTNTLFSDIRDKKGDELAGTTTLVVAFGATKCYNLLLALNTVWTIVVLTLFFNNIIDTPHLLVILSLILYPLAYILPYRANKFSKSTIDFISESDLLIFALGLIILSTF